MKFTAIIGIGNYLMCDEGAGIHAVEKLRKYEWSEDVELIDGGTAGLNIIHMIEGRKTVIFIDCADFGGKPGEIAVFDADTLKQTDEKMTGLHAVNLLTALALTKSQDHYPDKVIIVGIQPKIIKMGTTLSPEVEAALKMINDSWIFGLLPECGT